MKEFKIHQGFQEVFLITKENFEKQTLKQKPYLQRVKDDEPRCFAICTACDNPIQLIGLYKKPENTDKLYGKHYNRSVKDLAEYIHRNYMFCPYASHARSITKKFLKQEFFPIEKEIFFLVRDYFDIAIKILGEETGIIISLWMAKRILDYYVNSHGFMYNGATKNNIPWMLGYFRNTRPCYKLKIIANSPVFEYLSSRDDVLLTETEEGWVVNNNGKFLNLEIGFLFHRFENEKTDIIEKIDIVFSSTQDGKPKKEYSIPLIKDQSRFYNEISKNPDRNITMLNAAKELMPDDYFD